MRFPGSQIELDFEVRIIVFHTVVWSKLKNQVHGTDGLFYTFRCEALAGSCNLSDNIYMYFVTLRDLYINCINLIVVKRK